MKKLIFLFLLILISAKVIKAQPLFFNSFAYPNSMVFPGKSIGFTDGFIFTHISKDTLLNRYHLHIIKTNLLGNAVWQKQFYNDTSLRILNIFSYNNEKEFLLFTNSSFQTGTGYGPMRSLKFNINGDSLLQIDYPFYAIKIFKENDNKYKVIADSIYTIDTTGIVNYVKHIPYSTFLPSGTGYINGIPNIVADNFYVFAGIKTQGCGTCLVQFAGFCDSSFNNITINSIPQVYTTIPRDIIVLDSEKYIIYNPYNVGYDYFFSYKDSLHLPTFNQSIPGHLLNENLSIPVFTSTCNGILAYDESTIAQHFYFFDYSGNNLWNKNYLSSSSFNNSYPSNNVLVASDTIVILGKGLNALQHFPLGYDSLKYIGYSCNNLATGNTELFNKKNHCCPVKEFKRAV